MENSPARSSIDVGSVIAGTYIIEALIGRGGMGSVFLASHNRLPGKQVAIKVLHAELGGDEINARFKREAQIASLLSHPNIVHIEDYNVTAEGMPYLVLEYLQGESLAQRLRGGPMTFEAVAPILRQIGSALAAAHGKGIVHRDLKPQNIFLVPSEIDGRTMEIAKVLDFGISKMRDSQTVKTQESALLGTPQYMAPEQALGQHDKVDERTDIFALGAIIYEMLSGKPAFSGQTIPEVVFKVVYEAPVPLATQVPALSEHVTAAVQRALSKAPDERFPTVSALIESLTGSPVSLIRNPPSMPIDPLSSTSASGRTPNTGRDAFAQTMGSGDHGASPVAVDAVTIASQAGRVATPHLGSANTMAASERPAASSSKRPRLLIGGVLIAAVATAGIVYGVMRQPATTPAPVTPVAVAAPPPPVVTEPRNTPLPPDHIDVPAIEDELLGHGSAAIGSAAPVAALAPTIARPNLKQGTPNDRRPPPPDTTSGAGEEDNQASGRLREALASLAQHSWKAAAQAATLAATAESVRPKQLAQANMVLGIAACHLNDEEGGRNALRALQNNRVMRAKVLEVCHNQGWLTETKR